MMPNERASTNECSEYQAVGRLLLFQALAMGGWLPVSQADAARSGLRLVLRKQMGFLNSVMLVCFVRIRSALDDNLLIEVIIYRAI